MLTVANPGNYSTLSGMKSQTMRYRPDGSIELLELDVGDPQPGEVQLRGGVCGICSWDIATVKYGRTFHRQRRPVTKAWAMWQK